MYFCNTLTMYPLVIVFSYAMAPVPVVLFMKPGTPAIWQVTACFSSNSCSNHVQILFKPLRSPPQHWAWFTTGWIVISSFGIAVVLFPTQTHPRAPLPAVETRQVYRVAGTIASGKQKLLPCSAQITAFLQGTWGCRLPAASYATAPYVRLPA